jgi:hypothetical protein
MEQLPDDYKPYYKPHHDEFVAKGDFLKKLLMTAGIIQTMDHAKILIFIERMAAS